MGKHAFVTGGTGFIGINLIKLLLRNGWKVTALHRPSSDLTHLKKFPITLAEGSITDYTSLLNTLPDHIDVVFHLAGDTNLWSGHNERQWRVNVDGTRNMILAARNKNVPTFIHTSSTSAWGSMSGKQISESLPAEGGDSWVNYEKTKWEGEQIVRKHSGSDMKAVILNPATVTGPFDRNNWGRLFFALRDRELPGIPDGVVSVTHVREVAKAHLAAVEKGRSGENYILAGEDCRFSEFIHQIAKTAGIKHLPKRIPTPVLKLTARLHLFTSAIRGAEPGLTPELVKLMTRTNLSYSSQKAVDELDYKIIPMKQSVQDCYQWLTEEGYL